jgi:hypothetical protein
MSNSPLVKYTKISPNKTAPRNHAIDTITIHCMAGNCSVETCGEIFAPTSRQASSNYGIGGDGRVGMYVEEKDRSWCTSSASNDNRAVTIEVANDGGAETGWHVSDKALAALIDLCADVCKRNGINRLLWRPDKNNPGNMTVHRWFAAKSCPGDYLYGKHGYIADEVNKRLAMTEAPVLSSGSFIIRVTAAALNIRKGAGTNYAVSGTIRDRGTYTVVETSPGAGASKGWGRLKSGVGWISLDYVERI